MTFRSLLALTIFFSLTSLYGEDEPKKVTPSSVGVSMIDWYKETISPMKILTCSFHPSCSQYTKGAIQKHGLVKGWLLGCDRLMRCNHDLWMYTEVTVEGKLKKYDPVP